MTGRGGDVRCRLRHIACRAAPTIDCARDARLRARMVLGETNGRINMAPAAVGARQSKER